LDKSITVSLPQKADVDKLRVGNIEKNAKQGLKEVSARKHANA